MRNKYRIPKFCSILEEAWSTVPDWRFGQFIENLKRQFGILDMFYIEDDIMEKILLVYFFPERLAEKDIEEIEKTLNCKLNFSTKNNNKGDNKNDK